MQNTNALTPHSEQIAKLRDALALLNQPGQRTVKEMRTLIMGLEAAMQAMEGYLEAKDFDTKHHFAPGIYMRELFIPKGTVLTGKIHKTEHLNVISLGDVSVMTEEGVKRLRASSVVHSLPGIKRAIYAYEDSIWINVHHNSTNERDLDKIDDLFVVDTFEQFLSFKEQKQMIEGGL